MNNIATINNLKTVLIIHADESLDLSAFWEFKHTISSTRYNPENTTIVVDLSRTKKLFDSGKAALLALHDIVGHLKKPICINNADPDIQYQLYQSQLTEIFDIQCKQSVQDANSDFDHQIPLTS